MNALGGNGFKAGGRKGRLLEHTLRVKNIYHRYKKLTLQSERKTECTTGAEELSVGRGWLGQGIRRTLRLEEVFALVRVS